jgi:hypothetical protein
MLVPFHEKWRMIPKEYNVRSLNEKKNGGTEQTGYCSSRFCVLIFFFVFQNFGLDCFNN